MGNNRKMKTHYQKNKHTTLCGKYLFGAQEFIVSKDKQFVSCNRCRQLMELYGMTRKRKTWSDIATEEMCKQGLLREIYG